MFIRVLDLETSHESPDQGGGVVEIGYCDLHVTRLDLLGAPLEFEVDMPRAFLTFPGCPIPPATSAIHHLLDVDVCDAPPWRDEIRKAVGKGVAPGDMLAVAAHSSKFEALWLAAAGVVTPPQICTYKLALRMWPDAPLHSNMGLRYWRAPAGIQRSTALPAHRAGPDAYVTAFLLRELLEQGARDHTMSIEQAVKVSSEPALLITCGLGQWRGKPWADVDDGFLRWVLDKDFDEDTKYTARHWINEHQRQWEAERAARQA